MCTAMTMRSGAVYFGRNLDMACSFGEKVTVTPRRFSFALQDGKIFKNTYAMIGMAAILEDMPQYYEATNEAGLSMAALNFPKNAVYFEDREGMDNTAPSDLIFYIVGQADSVQAARKILEKVNLSKTHQNPNFPFPPFHYMLSDRRESLVLEPTADGLQIYENPFDVLTNNPPFLFHRWNMQGYLRLSPANAENRFSKQYPLENYGVGMGAVGLPGDASSASRFVRAAFHLTNSEKNGDELKAVTQFFHVLGSVEMLRGSTLTDDGQTDFTLYSSCCNADTGVYYYKTYGNSQITAVDMYQTDLNAETLTAFPLRQTQNVLFEHI